MIQRTEEGEMTAPTKSAFAQRPATTLGWWAFGLAAAFVGMFVINTAVFMPGLAPAWWRQTILPFYGIFMMLCGIAAGVVGLIALIRGHERSWMVWIAILPGAFALFFVLGEFLVPH
jgi:hypothetical protein